MSETNTTLDNKINLQSNSVTAKSKPQFCCSVIISSSVSDNTNTNHNNNGFSSLFSSIASESPFPYYSFKFPYPHSLQPEILHHPLATPFHHTAPFPETLCGGWTGHGDGGRQKALRWKHSPHCQQRWARQDCSRTWRCWESWGF